MKKLLVCDDSRSIRMLLESVLSPLFELTILETGKQALAAAMQQEYDLILSDLNMPDMTGLEFLAEVRKLPNYHGVPFILLTTETDQNLKAQGRSLGATGWITKPFSPEVLVKTLHKVMD